MTSIVVIGGAQLSQPAQTPHLFFPFTMTADGAVTVQQDTVEEVAACVTAICSCIQGEREDVPDFGIPPLLFSTLPINVDGLAQAILQWEPRAQLAVTATENASDASDVTIVVEVTGVNGA